MIGPDYESCAKHSEILKDDPSFWINIRYLLFMISTGLPKGRLFFEGETAFLEPDIALERCGLENFFYGGDLYDGS